MFCGRLEKILRTKDNMKNHFKTLTHLEKKLNDLQKNKSSTCKRISEMCTQLKEISNKVDAILNKLNIKESEIKKEFIKETKKEDFIFRTPVKIRLSKI